MKAIQRNIIPILIIIFLSVNVTCLAQTSNVPGSNVKKEKKKKKRKKVKLPKIDLSHWKVTIPEGTGKEVL